MLFLFHWNMRLVTECILALFQSVACAIIMIATTIITIAAICKISLGITICRTVITLIETICAVCRNVCCPVFVACHTYGIACFVYNNDVIWIFYFLRCSCRMCCTNNTYKHNNQQNFGIHCEFFVDIIFTLCCGYMINISIFILTAIKKLKK